MSSKWTPLSTICLSNYASKCKDYTVSRDGIISDYWFEVEVEFTNNGQTTNLSWCRVPIRAHYQTYIFSLRNAGFFMWGSLSDEKMGLQFTSTFVSGPCQSSYTRVQFPQNSRPYFTVSFETAQTWRAR
jgi:hypothetical protein